MVEAERLIEREQYWLDLLKSYDRSVGYNMRPKADNQLGLVHTDESIAKISARKKGSRAWNKGIPMSDEAKAKLRIVKTGKKHSPETIAKMIAMRKGGNGHSAVTRALMSIVAKKLGRKPSALCIARSVEVRRAKAHSRKEMQSGRKSL